MSITISPQGSVEQALRTLQMECAGLDVNLSPVATYADLPADADEGATKYVLSRQSMYLRAGGVWNRTRLTDPSVATSEWWVSSSTGDDDNDGQSDSTPVKHISEIVGRIGDTNVGQITIHVMDDLEEEDLVISGKCAADGLHWIFISGQPTVDLTTTIAAVTQWDVSTSTNVVGTMRGTASLISHVGKIFRIVGGARDGAYGQLGAVESGTNVIFAPPQFGLYIPGSVQPQVGDTIEVLSQPHFCNTITVDPECTVFIDNVQIGDGNTHGITTSPNSALWLSGCTLDNGVDAGNSSFISLIACAVNQSARAEGAVCFLEIYGCHAQQVTCRSNSEVNLGDMIVHGTLSVNTKGLCNVIGGTFAYFDTLPPGYAAVNVGIDALFDMNNAAVGGRNINSATLAKVQISTGGHFYYSTKANISGSNADYWIGGTTKTSAEIPFVNTANNALVALHVP